MKWLLSALIAIVVWTAAAQPEPPPPIAPSGLRLYTPRVMPMALEGAWGLDEGSGTTAADSSGNGRNGTLLNATWATGKYGQGVNFAAAGDRITLPNITAPSTAITIMGWFKPSELTNQREAEVIVRRTGAGVPFFSYGLKISGNNTTTDPSFSIGIGSAIHTVSLSVSLTSVGTWYHLAGTWASGGKLKIYLNGVLNAESAASPSGSINYASANVSYIGWDNLDNKSPRGVLDEVRIYSHQLTQTEIQTDRDTPIGATTNTASLSLDALIKKTGILQTVNIDALIQKQLSAQLSIDSAVQDSFSTTLSADAILQAVLSGQVSLDSLLQASPSINISIDSLLQSPDISATTVLDALLRDSLSSTASLDAVLTGGSSASLVLDSLLQSGQVTTVDIDAVLQTQDVTATAVIDALLQAQAITVTTVLDALLQQAKTGTVSLDAVLTGAAGTNAFISLDSLLQSAQSAGTSIDAMLQAADQAATASIDAVLQQLKTATINLDSLIQSTASVGVSIDALLQVAALSATLDIDSLLQQLKTGTISIDAFLISASTVGLSLDAKLLGTNSGTLSIDAIIGVVTQAISKAGFTIQTRAFGFRKLSG